MTAIAQKPLLIIPAPDPMDDCDHSSCPAKAMVRVAIPGGGSLVFCGHHYDYSPQSLKNLILGARDMRDVGWQ